MLPKRNLIVICAHPDDCDLTSGGIALLMKGCGFNVKFVSVTNGDKGHQLLKPKEIAKRRYEETQAVQRLTGIIYEVLDIPDGCLVNTLENREKIIKLIREWNADIVITHRPSDYHPDHRTVATLVQDAAFMVTVPHVLPSVTALSVAPVFMHTRDRFLTPRPFRADLVVDISSVIRKKAEMLNCHASQMYEWLPFINNIELPILQEEEDRIRYLIESYVIKRGYCSDSDLQVLKRCYVKGHKSPIAVEAFELSEYGQQIPLDDLKLYFPFLSC